MVIRIIVCNVCILTHVIDLGETNLPMTYLSSIPLVPELGADRKLEPLRLRDMRKRLDNGNMTMLDIEAMVFECMDEIVELCNGKQKDGNRTYTLWMVPDTFYW